MNIQGRNGRVIQVAREVSPLWIPFGLIVAVIVLVIVVAIWKAVTL